MSPAIQAYKIWLQGERKTYIEKDDPNVITRIKSRIRRTSCRDTKDQLSIIPLSQQEGPRTRAGPGSTQHLVIGRRIAKCHNLTFVRLQRAVSYG